MCSTRDEEDDRVSRQHSIIRVCALKPPTMLQSVNVQAVLYFAIKNGP